MASISNPRAENWLVNDAIDSASKKPRPKPPLGKSCSCYKSQQKTGSLLQKGRRKGWFKHCSAAGPPVTGRGAGVRWPARGGAWGVATSGAATVSRIPCISPVQGKTW